MLSNMSPTVDESNRMNCDAEATWSAMVGEDSWIEVHDGLPALA